MRTIELLEEAVEEAIAAINWYDHEQAGLGHKFSQALDDALRLIEEDVTPLLQLSGKSPPTNTKRVILKRLPYDIIIERPGKIIVVAIAHHARKPGYWHDRVTA